jgi:hypothetical protein
MTFFFRGASSLSSSRSDSSFCLCFFCCKPNTFRILDKRSIKFRHDLRALLRVVLLLHFPSPPPPPPLLSASCEGSSSSSAANTTYASEYIRQTINGMSMEWHETYFDRHITFLCTLFFIAAFFLAVAVAVAVAVVAVAVAVALSHLRWQIVPCLQLPSDTEGC